MCVSVEPGGVGGGVIISCFGAREERERESKNSKNKGSGCIRLLLANVEEERERENVCVRTMLKPQ